MKSIPLHTQKEKRQIWTLTRSFMETDNYKYKRNGRKSKSHWTLFERLVHVFGFLLKITNLYKTGYHNAKNIIINDVNINFPELPESFNSYKILHLSDLHLNCIKGIENIICRKIKSLSYDICVLTGDYRENTYGSFKQILTPMKKIADTINAKDGILAVLGNHDSYLMVNHFEEMGIKILTNETISICRKNDQIAVTGIDDPHYYYTDQALYALEEECDNFKIVMVHSPELYDLAADNEYNLYLCGHTHGGQICLPGGIPLITHVYAGKKFHRGLWKYSNMKGYTNQGCSTVCIPVRFYSESEIALITLKKSN